jgi:N-acetylneuraminic acid mutarotase
MPPLPFPRCNHKQVTVDGVIYVLGGLIEGHELREPASEARWIVSVQRLNNRTGSWDNVSSLPCPVEAFTASVFDAKIYVFGGKNKKTCNNCVFVYTPLFDEWTQIGNMPSRRSLHSVTVLCGHIYIIGGHKITGRSCIKKVCKDVDQFNPVTEEWISVGDLNQVRASHETFVHRGVLGVMCGDCNTPPLPTRSGHGRHATTFGEMYDPYHNKWVATHELFRESFGRIQFDIVIDHVLKDVNFIDEFIFQKESKL